jgi:hypothetical protein
MGDRKGGLQEKGKEKKGGGNAGRRVKVRESRKNYDIERKTNEKEAIYIKRL